MRDALDKELNNEALKELIEVNEQKLSKTGRDDLVSFAADMMLYGPLMPCDVCKNGQLVFKGNAYYCQGNITEWTRCTFKTQTPKRQSHLNLSDEFREEFPCLKKFKFQNNNVRIFAKTLEELSKEKKEKSENPNIKKPLFNMNFSTHGKLTRKNDEIKVVLGRLGGKLQTTLSNLTVALITNEEEVEKMNKKLKEAVSLDIHVISEKFLDEITSTTNFEEFEKLILKHKLHTCGSDLKKRVDLCVQSNETSASNSAESKFLIKSLGDGSGKVKMKVKG